VASKGMADKFKKADAKQDAALMKKLDKKPKKK
jgi:hypothetical protein